jgi:hypothetical protein
MTMLHSVYTDLTFTHDQHRDSEGSIAELAKAVTKVQDGSAGRPTGKSTKPSGHQVVLCRICGNRFSHAYSGCLLLICR